MPKRTKEQKRKAQKSRVTSTQEASPEVTQKVQYSFSASTHDTAAAKQTASILPGMMLQYVRKDLLKTAITASLLLIVLVGIYFYLSYN